MSVSLTLPTTSLMRVMSTPSKRRMVACISCSFCGSYKAERSIGRTAAVRPGVTVGEEGAQPRRLQQLEPTRWLHHSRDPAALSDSPTGTPKNLTPKKPRLRLLLQAPCGPGGEPNALRARVLALHDPAQLHATPRARRRLWPFRPWP